jgi:hypothetical protein
MSNLEVCGKCMGYVKSGEKKISHYEDCPLTDKQKKETNRVVKNMQKGKECQRCKSVGGENGKLFMCSGCNCTFYCSTKCQKEDWKSHKKECSKDLINKKVEEKEIEDEIDNSCIESYKREYKKNIGETFLMRFYESFWTDRGEFHLLERAKKEAKKEMK